MRKYVWILIVFLCFFDAIGQKRTVRRGRNASRVERITPVEALRLQEKEQRSSPDTGDDILLSDIPVVEREFRGAWVATVANINWPSSRNLSTSEQKREAIALLDLLANAHFNAVIFQVRPSADALYESLYEPWSYFLTGATGQSPDPYYDPLHFWIEEAHKRGLELHVWINPYRVHHLSGGRVSTESMVYKASDHVVRLSNGMYWFDPASKKTQDHVSDVIRDIVKRYDIDAVHFDDYFYPYKSYNGGADFPDHASWSVYRNSGGTLNREDWRRDQVNRIVERIHREIKEIKPYVKFGISPFGIWKPGYPYGVSGMSQYDELYADAKLWLNKGWVDYFSPQLYWPIEAKKQSFRDLLEWWQEENTHQRHLWPGLNTVEIKAANKANEIVNQVQLTRELVPLSKGAVHYSVAGLTNNGEMVRELKQRPYRNKALIPMSPWIKAPVLEVPKFEFSIDNTGVFVQWEKAEEAFQWLLYAQYGAQWEVQMLTKDQLHQKIPVTKNGQSLKNIALKSVDRLGNESRMYAKKVG